MNTMNLLVWRIKDYVAAEYDAALDTSYSNWSEYVGRQQRLADGIMYQVAPTTSRTNLKKRPGAWYFHFLKTGVIEQHISGFGGSFNVAVKVTNAWMDKVHSTIEHEATEEQEAYTETIKNSDYYSAIQNIAKTHWLIKFTDKDFAKLYEAVRFTNDFATNIIANQDYVDAINEGGEFYVEPIEPII